MKNKYRGFNKQKKRNQIIKLGIILLTIILFIGTSYALLRLTLFGEKKLDVTAGTLAVEFKEGNVVSLENAYPISDSRASSLEPYEFTIENTGTITAKYDISLEEEKVANRLNYEHIKYSIKKNEEEWSSPRLLSTLNGLVLEQGVSFEVGEKNTYSLKFWIDENAGNEAQGREFKARIIINSVQVNAMTEDVSIPIIRLNGELVLNLEEGDDYIEEGVESVQDDKDTLDKTDVGITYEYYDGESINKVDRIDTSKTGTYYIYYKIKDKSGNEGASIRTVNIYKKDMTIPIIQLNGKSVIAIEKNQQYLENGATARKGEEDLTDRIVIVGEVNPKQIGSYFVKYLITDNEGNTASVVRTVNVITVNKIRDEIILDTDKITKDQIKVEGENLGNIYYAVEDSNVIEIDGNGNITVNALGETKVIITTDSGYTKEVIVKVIKTVTVTYVKQGSGISSIGKASDSCIITNGNSCTVVAPSIDGINGYTVVGWNTNQNAQTGIRPGEIITLVENVTYYSISYKAGVTYHAYFNGNGGSVSSSDQSCTVNTSWNDDTPATSCTVTTPVITAPSATPTPLGYHMSASATTAQLGVGATLTLNSNNNGVTYYAITRKDAVSRVVYFNANGNTIGSTSASCSIGATYNGTSQASSCNVTTPVITAPSATPSIIGYSTSASSRTAVVGSGASFTVSSSNHGGTYYAQTTKAATSRIVYFNANGNTISATNASCTIGATYNGTSQASSCNVITPVITAPNATPSIIGYSTSASSRTAVVGSGASFTVSSSNHGGNYYAQTKNNTSHTYNVRYVVGMEGDNGVTAISKKEDSCTAILYNGATRGVCNVTLPTISYKSGYGDEVYWERQGETYGIASTVTLGDGMSSTFYAFAFDKTPPKVSYSYSSDYVMLTATDAGTVTGELIWSIGGIELAPTATSKMRQYVIASGRNIQLQNNVCLLTNSPQTTYRTQLIFTVPAGRVTDSSGNKSLATTITAPFYCQ